MLFFASNVRKIPKLCSIHLSLLMFIFIFAFFSLIHGSYFVLIRLLLSYIFFLIGYYIFSLNHYFTLKIGVMFTVLVTVFLYFNQILPSHDFVYGPIRFLGVYPGDRFSATFNDPTKFAAFYYLSFSFGIIGLMVAMLVSLISGGRLSSLITLYVYVARFVPLKLLVISSMALPIFILVYFDVVNEFLLSIFSSMRPETGDQEVADYVRVYSAIKLYSILAGLEPLQLVTVGSTNEFLNGVPPHNSYLSTLLETGYIGFLSLILLSAALMFSATEKTFIPTSVILLLFLAYDAQTYRILYFYMGGVVALNKKYVRTNKWRI